MGWPTGWLVDASTGTPTDLNLSATSPKAVYANNIVAGNTTQLNYSVSTASPTSFVFANSIAASVSAVSPL